MMERVDSKSGQWLVRAGIFVPLALLGSLPLWMYFELQHHAIISAMFVIFGAVHLLVGAHTTAIASRLMVHYRNVGGQWDFLVLADVPPRRITFRIWLAIVRQTWINHAMLAVPRLGFGVALAQFFNSSPMNQAFSSLIYVQPPFMYYSYNSFYGRSYSADNPQLLQIVVALIVLIVYCLVECGLFTALGMLWSGWMPRREHYAIAYAVVSRIGIGLAAVVMYIVVVHTLADWVSAYDFSPPSGFGVQLDYVFCESTPEVFHPGQDIDEYCNDKLIRLQAYRAIEAGQVTLTTFMDNGALLSASILRPRPYPLIQRPGFYIRQLVSAVFGLVLYALLIWFVLRTINRHFIHHYNFRK